MINITKVPEQQTDHIAILTSLSNTEVMSTNPKPKYNTKKANWPIFQDILVSFDYSEREEFHDEMDNLMVKKPEISPVGTASNEDSFKIDEGDCEYLSKSDWNSGRNIAQTYITGREEVQGMM
ncbi:hypothetical protein QYM36_005175 [Artemia franciscana]|uniref:Uncharacterized protein n=1 Tax=Artemia franciscana TaxID=6661 RepID=A0AA88LFG5_ARTSF|nr:hypothetical protein QYM36_005175 [Artemia franciscana]